MAGALPILPVPPGERVGEGVPEVIASGRGPARRPITAKILANNLHAANPVDISGTGKSIVHVVP
jgi:hypothetical protein